MANKLSHPETDGQPDVKLSLNEHGHVLDGVTYEIEVKVVDDAGHVETHKLVGPRTQVLCELAAMKERLNK